MKKKTSISSLKIITVFIFFATVSIFSTVQNNSLNQQLSAQEIEATVNIVTEGMMDDPLYNIESFPTALEQYINSQRFSDIDWEGPKIPINISIQLSAMGKNSYSANLFIVSKRTINGDENMTSTAMRFEDNGKWGFMFSNGLSISYDFNRYDEIASLIDFYMLIIIGLDLDSYGELDGDQCFQRARRIFDMAVSKNIDGWESFSRDYGRKTLIEDVTSPRMDVFRKLMFEYYVDGIDLIVENKAEALQNMTGTVSRMADFKERYLNPTHLMDAFFSTKCQEMCELFRGYTENTKIFRDLMFLDPTNTVRYEASRDGK